MNIPGRCVCGRTSYEISNDEGIDIANCHCRTCRQASGGAYITWATVPRDRFTWTGDKPAEFQSSSHTTRFFCRGCGAQLALFTTNCPATIDVTVTTFDHPEDYPPTRDIWVKSHLRWVPRDPALPGEERE